MGVWRRMTSGLLACGLACLVGVTTALPGVAQPSQTRPVTTPATHLATTQTVQAAPVLTSPASGQSITGTVTFGWGKLSGHAVYQIAVSTSSTFTRPILVSVNGTQVRLLLESGRHYWRVRAIDNTATSWSSARTVNVTATTTWRPAAPYLRTPSAGTVGTADPKFTWTTVTGRSHYDLRLSRYSSMASPTTWSAGTTGRTLRLNRGTWYWQVRSAADGSVLNGRWSTVRRIYVNPPTDVYPPSRPGALTVSSVGTTSAQVSFGASKDDSGKVRYQVLANNVVLVNTTATQGVLVPLKCGTVYTFAARALDPSNNVSPLSPTAKAQTRSCPDVTPPAAPSGLVVKNRTYSSVTLGWTASTDPGNGTVGSYLLYRDGKTVGGSTTTSYTFTGLAADQLYTFSVRARDKVGNISSAVSIRAITTMPPQATGSVSAYVLATDADSFADAQKHYMAFRQVYPTFFEVDASGSLGGTGEPVMTRWFSIRGVKVMPRVHSEDPGVIEAVVTDPARRTLLVDEVATAVSLAGYDGVNLDFEMGMPATGINGMTQQQRWDNLRNGFALLVEQMAAKLHSQGHELSVDVAVNWCAKTDSMTRETIYCASATDRSATTRSRPYLYDYARIATAADEMFLLAWGLHWTTSEAGPIADIRWLAAVRDYYASLFAATPDLMSKITLGTSLYGFDWSYRVVRQDTVTMPGVLPAAPLCAPSTTVKARPRFSYTADATAGTLTITWVCNNRNATPMEYDAIVQTIAAVGVSMVSDPGSAEFTYSFTESGGALREGWLSTAATITARSNLAAAAGWRMGLWRLGNEDQTMWTATGLTGA